MRTTLFITALIICGFSACRQKGPDNLGTGANDRAAADSATEETMLHPKFDENKIHGLGIFKIGVSVENSIGKLLEDKKLMLDTVWNQSKTVDLFLTKDLKRRILKINPPLTTLNGDTGVGFSGVYLYNWNKRITVYLMPYYVVDSVTMNDLTATYYDNKLVRVRCSEPGFMETIKLKYGKPDKILKDSLRYYYIYYNGDLTAGVPEKLRGFAVEVRGSVPFLEGCSARARAMQDSIERVHKVNQLKNL